MSKKHKGSWKSKKTFNLGNKPKQPQQKQYKLQEFQIHLKNNRDLFEDLNELVIPAGSEKKPKTAKLRLFQSPSTNIDIFNKYMKNIGTLSYKQTKELVEGSYGRVLNELIGKKLDKKYTLFFKCLSEYSKEVHFDYALYETMNDIAYNAIMYTDLPDDMIKYILEITDKININTICHLYADSGITMEQSNLLSLANNSTEEPFKKVDRVNKMMCLIGDKFDVQTIIDMYESLYTSIFEVYGATTTMQPDPVYDKKILANADAVITKQADAVVSILNQAPWWALDEVLDLCNANFDAPNKWLLEVLSVETEDNDRVRNAIRMRVGD